MRGSILHWLALGGLALTACSVDAQDQTVEEAEQPIVRAKSEGGDEQVVLLYGQFIQNGQLRVRSCSGTLIGPRVVLTAAHCVENIWNNQLFAYWGDDFPTDFAALQIIGQTIVVPPPGQPSKFAQADSSQAHPDFDPSLNDPDIAVVFLDRKPPFKPLQIAPFHMNNTWNGEKAKLVGWGASQALSADISQTVGLRVKRTGKATILGTPTAADFHEEDPNPAMLFPELRRHFIKTDGRAPNANSCAGDSGGPMLLRLDHEDYVAGVSSWTGLWCEDYSLFTRTDTFRSFINKELRRGGDSALKAHLDCVTDNGDGTFSAFFGYENKNGVSLTVTGGRNSLPLDVNNRRPTRFLPGEHDFAFSVDFQKKEQVVWRLDPEFGPTSVVHAKKQSPRCGAEVDAQVSCSRFCAGSLDAGCPEQLPSYSQCMSDCVQQFDFFPDCHAELVAMNQCYGNTPSGPDSWLCLGDGTLPFSFNCDPETIAFYTCLGF